MKRSAVSSSCLLQPRSSGGASSSPPSSLLAAGAGHHNHPHGGGSQSHPNLKPAASVTILNTETLPTYSSERFYMLSEIEMNAPPVVFLSNLEHDEGEPVNGNVDDVDDAATVDTETDERTTSATAATGTTTTTVFPPCLILYILWKPTAEQDAESFVAQTLQKQLKRLQQHVDICSFEEMASSRVLQSSTASTAGTTTSRATSAANNKAVLDENGQDDEPQAAAAEEDKDETTSSTNGHTTTAGENEPVRINTSDNSSGIRPKPKCSVYIVVDRLSPAGYHHQTGSTSATGSAITEEGRIASATSTTDQVAEQLARAVATHETFRAIVQGITVGVSNHVRAAPGLEACYDAVSVSAKDRRQVLLLSPSLSSSPATANKSLLGIVADSPDDLLGLADPNECDAAQGVRQLKISAEYNGRGNLQSFAGRAHDVWRQRHGLPPPPKAAGGRRIPRRIRRAASSVASSSSSARTSREMEFFIYDAIAILVLILYVSFHSGHLLFPKQRE